MTQIKEWVYKEKQKKEKALFDKEPKDESKNKSSCRPVRLHRN